ncbi:hypothetical protein PoHVEF18_008738 [Penicillium ochrochloron]
MSKLITVFGVTEQQGGSVIRTILQDEILSKEFKIRGITRDTSEAEAQALLNHNSSLGRHRIRRRTHPRQNVADAAKETGVQHLIFSSLLDVTKETDGRLKHVPHSDQKVHVEEYIRSIGVPATFVLPGYFMNNYTQIPLLRKGEDGVYTRAYPVGEGALFPLVDIIRDMGKFVAAALKNRSEVLGTQILAAANYYTPTRILAEFEEVTAKKTRFVQVDSESYTSFMPGRMGEEMLENHLFIESPGYYRGRSLKESHDLLGKAGYKT